MNVCAHMCSTCIYRADTPLVDRRHEMEDEAVAADSFIVCHSTLSGWDEDTETWATDVARHQAVCRGFYDRHGGGQLGRIAERLGVLNLEFAPPDKT